MRVGLFTPLPPARSGIADYAEALAGELRHRVDLKVFTAAAPTFDADIALYQIGNNGFHDFAYETALRHPGVVVLHEANLHHLIADITIRRGDWDSYVRECEHNRGPEGGIHGTGRGDSARRVDSGGGPQYLPEPARTGRIPAAGGCLRFP